MRLLRAPPQAVNCVGCHKKAQARRKALEKAAPGSHTKAEWLAKAATYTHCPCCGRLWAEVERPGRQKLPFTKGHIIGLKQGGSQDISNLQPECARCNYGKPDAGRRQAA